MKKLYQTIAVALAALLHVTAARATCTAPSGTYVGVGTGVHYTCNTAPSNGKCASGYVDDVNSITSSITFSSSTAGPMKWRFKKLGLAAVDITFTLPKMITTTATSPSTSSSTYHYFNSTLCRGYVKANGVLDDSSVSIGGSIGVQFVYVSSGSGAVVTVVYDSSDDWSSATYTMRLEKP